MIVENWISQAGASATGNPVFLGLLVLGFFIGFVTLSQTRIDVKLMVMVSAVILASAYIPWLVVLGSIVFGYITYWGLMKAINK